MKPTRLVLAIAFVFSAAAPAAADVLPPCGAVTDSAPCSGKKAGDVCTFANGNAGNCATLRCTNDAGQAQLQCVATGAMPGGGCSATPAAAAPGAGVGLLLLASAAALLRRRRA